MHPQLSRFPLHTHPLQSSHVYLVSYGSFAAWYTFLGSGSIQCTGSGSPRSLLLPHVPMTSFLRLFHWSRIRRALLIIAARSSSPTGHTHIVPWPFWCPCSFSSHDPLLSITLSPDTFVDTSYWAVRFFDVPSTLGGCLPLSSHPVVTCSQMTIGCFTLLLRYARTDRSFVL